MNVLVPACSRAECGVGADVVSELVWCRCCPRAPALPAHSCVSALTVPCSCPGLSNMPDLAVVIRKTSQGCIDNREFEK